MTIMITIPKVGAFDLSIRLPQVSRARMVTTTSLSGFFTSVWIATPALLPFASVDAKMIVSGFVVPFGTGYVSLLLAERRVRRDLLKASEVPQGETHPSARQGQAEVRLAEHVRTRVIEGEVLPR